MAINVNDVIRMTAVLDHSLEGTVQNVYWVKQNTTGVDDAVFITAAAAALDTAYDLIDALFPTTLTFDEIRFFNMTQDTPMPPTSWPTLTAGGVSASEPLPAVLSQLVFGRTGVSRRLFRKYFGPFTVANINDANFTGAVGTAALLLVNSLTAGWVSGAGTAHVGLYSNTLGIFYDINELIARTIPAYQRRRRRGRGA